MVKFLKSQGEIGQEPLSLETGWLAIGHIDEMVQFLPCEKGRLGFTIAISDTRSTLDILKGAREAEYGDAPLISYKGDMTPDEETSFLSPELVQSTNISSVQQRTCPWKPHIYQSQLSSSTSPKSMKKTNVIIRSYFALQQYDKDVLGQNPPLADSSWQG